MDKLKEEFIAWVEKMGYDGVINENVLDLLTPQTAHIWRQLIENVRPKHEVDLIRKNILVNRLKKKIGPRGDTSAFASSVPIPEVQAYNRRQELDAKVTFLRRSLIEKEQQLEKLVTANKMKYLELENSEKRIEEHKRFTMLLDAKRDQLKTEIANVDALLTSVKNVTPVAVVSKPPDEIKKVLLKSAEDAQKPDDSFGLLGNALVESSNNDSCFLAATPVTDGDILQNLMRENNRKTIADALTDMAKECVTELVQISHTEINEPLEPSVDLTDLHKVHIKTELLAMKAELEAKKLRRQLGLPENQPMPFQATPDDLQRAKETLFRSLGAPMSSKDELHAVEQALVDQRKELWARQADLRAKSDELLAQKTKIADVRHGTKVFVRDLQQFSRNVDWCEPLGERVVAREVETFEKFPLEYNRGRSDGKVRKRDTFVDVNATDEDELRMLATAIERPYSFPEEELFSIAETKSLVRRLEKTAEEALPDVSCSLEGLKEKEGYVRKSVDTMNKMVEQETRALGTLAKVEEVVDLWLEMPFKHYVAPNKTVEEKKYDDFDRSYERLYKQL